MKESVLSGGGDGDELMMMMMVNVYHADNLITCSSCNSPIQEIHA